MPTVMLLLGLQDSRESSRVRLGREEGDRKVRDITGVQGREQKAERPIVRA